MIKIAANVSFPVSGWPQSSAGIGWRRVWQLGPGSQHVKAAAKSHPWAVWKEGACVFSGTKQQCEDWLDRQDREARKLAASK
jgi:hypothetical protein